MYATGCFGPGMVVSTMRCNRYIAAANSL
jgi:hypothetical protein